MVKPVDWQNICPYCMHKDSYDKKWHCYHPKIRDKTLGECHMNDFCTEQDYDRCKLMKRESNE